MKRVQAAMDDEDLYRVVWKSRATNASGRGKPLTRAAAEYDIVWMKRAWPEHDHWLEIVGERAPIPDRIGNATT
jgi:hypothetical protein